MAKSIYINYIDEWAFNDLKFIIENTSEKKLDIFIFSQGGNIDAGFAMAHYIEAISNKTITTHILGNVSSAATLPFLAAQKRKAVASAYFMGHNPSMYADFMIGSKLTDEQIESAKAQVEFQRNRLIDYYVSKISGLSRDEIESRLNEDIFLTADEMKELGIITEIVEKYDIAAHNENFLNQYKMNIFNKKTIVNDIALSDTVKAIYEGDLKEGIELRPLGSTENINGEFVVNEKNIVVKDNKIISITDVEKKPVENDNAITQEDLQNISTEIENKVTKIITDLLAPIIQNNAAIQAKFEKLGIKTPKIDVPKREVGNDSALTIENVHAEIKKREREKRSEILNNRKNL